MSQDRPDLMNASCHLAQAMSAPTEFDWMRLKRFARYVKGAPVMKIQYRLQDDEEKLTEVILQTDSDWANNIKDRRSHSGGVLCVGAHFITGWSRVQPVIALSSGEAELYSAVIGLPRLAGLLNLLRELRGSDWGIPVHQVDASACKGILLRRGTGGVKHLEVKDLWAQELIRRKSIQVRKIARTENCSDSLAFYSCPRTKSEHMRKLGCEVNVSSSSMAVWALTSWTCRSINCCSRPTT